MVFCILGKPKTNTVSELSPIDHLDFVLELLKHRQHNANSLIVSHQGAGFSADPVQIQRVVKKLEKDGYIEILHISRYVITYEGDLFHGYKRQKEIDDLNYETALRASKRGERIANHLVYATYFAGIAAALLLLWQIFLYFYPVHADYPYFFGTNSLYKMG